MDTDLYPVRTLFEFITRTVILRETLPKDHTLFLTYLDQEEKPCRPVRPTATSNWIKEAMTAAGINIIHFQAHSMRSASSTKAVELVHTTQSVKKKNANWSLNSDTFEKLYYKLSKQTSSMATINNSIFLQGKVSHWKSKWIQLELV
jgi:hypothetical protein